MADGRGEVLRRKLGSVKAEAQAQADAGKAGPDKAWRMALARSARDQVKLTLDVTRLRVDRMSLAELLDLAPERGLIAVLEGPKQALGVILIAPDVMAGIIEAQTTGVVTAAPAQGRRPTRTDAAMMAGMIDGALAEVEQSLQEVEDCTWALGYRYASFLEDIRPLGLLLEDIPYKMLRAEVSLAFGAKTGEIFMALPARTRMGAAPLADDVRAAAKALMFKQDLAAHVMGAGCELVGVLNRMSLTLAQVMDFEVGMVLPLGAASVERISVEGLDGRALWEGKLGQNRGMCAVRLTEQLGGFSAGLPPLSHDNFAQSGDHHSAGEVPQMEEPMVMNWATGTG